MRNDSANGTTRDTLSGQNKFLNSEVLRVSAKCDQLENELTRIKKDYHQTHEDLQTLRCDYIYAIQSAIQIPLHDNSGLDVMNVNEKYQHVDRILKLLAEARREDPSLPTLKSVLQGSYVDSFGFRVCYKEEPLALHYLATKLHHFYLSRSSSFVEHKLEWRNFLEEQTEIELTKETKHLCRNGIPNSLRSTVWKILINQQVDDLKLLYGKYYYRNLCNTRGGEDEQKFSENHQKQINLDLLRTMPNNVHFMSATSKGISQLQQVLRAFCLHNPEIGYCQGMNFLTATALLFVGPEDAFWFLIAITEKYFDKTYFDSNLTGAQADQEVLKEMLEAQHPRITRHLNSLDIDVASISLNWFIALFFDAVPFNTMLRIWDCFLLEGPKVLFRFALVLLGKHENEIISRNDAIGIMRVSKAASRLAFDEHAVVEMAFSIKNLPTRAELKTLQTQYVVALSEKLERRSKRAAAFVNSISPRSNNRLISNIFMNEFCSSSGFIVSGHHMMGKVAKIQIQNDKAEIKEIDIEFDCRVMSICMAQRDLVYVSLISGFLILAYVDSMDNWSIMWELKLPDVAVCLIQRDGTLFAALANGTLSVFENACEKWPTNVQMWHLPLSSAPLVNAVIQDDLLVVASSCKLITLDALSLTILNTTHVASCSASSGNIYFDKISCMCDSPYGIFLSTDQSTLIQLWNEVTCNLLYEVSFDHKNRKPSLFETESNVHINSILYNSGFLWIGTSDGYVIIYNVFDDGLQEADGIQYRLKRFSSERKYARTSQMKLQKLGSLKEHREEDSDDSDHMGVFSHRVRINIDPEKQQYKVASVTVDKEEEDDEGLQQGSSRVNSACAKILRSPLNKGLSGDSAVSVFSSEPCVEQTTLENRVDDLFLQPKMALHHPHNRIASTDSSCTSMEYDDIFELYSDEDRSRRRVAITSPKRIGCNKKIQLKRKDLAFDEPYIVPIPVKGTSRDSACDADTSIVFPKVRLSLLMKLKVSDSSVRKIVAKSESHVLTCSGEFGADEAVLLWKQDPESVVSLVQRSSDNAWRHKTIDITQQSDS
ncbi:unnamed protein product [Caenorhabditis auriculariae]|uniref:Rab-GAP TBC domain-containing protein n=1 Tax=Caenorhabditis auriculariae TaxID=2777116 RepID=A0A8S1GW11_9PELO|nr:unnamed protein product [Caenorhabditis auriculariae]